MKHKIKNISNRQIPVDGIEIAPKQGEIVVVDMTERNKWLVKDKFYEDLGEEEYQKIPINPVEVKPEIQENSTETEKPKLSLSIGQTAVLPAKQKKKKKNHLMEV
jgi:hypothetical protein